MTLVDMVSVKLTILCAAGVGCSPTDGAAGDSSVRVAPTKARKSAGNHSGEIIRRSLRDWGS